jgi:hypothetical protein
MGCADDDVLLRSLIVSGEPPRAIAQEMKRTVAGQAGLSEQPAGRKIRRLSAARRENPGCLLC